MASKDEEFETDDGIEASDLASLLCRFEEATSSVNDLNLQVEKKSRNKFIKVRNSRITSDSALSSAISLKSSTVANKRKADEVLQFASPLVTGITSSDTSCFKSPQTKQMTKPATLSFLNSKVVPVQIDESETIVDSHLMAESCSSLSMETFEHPENSVIFKPHEQSSSTNLLFKKELMLQDTVSECGTLTSVNLHKYESSIPLAESAKQSFISLTAHEIYSEVFPTVDTLKDDISVSRCELIQSLQKQNSVLPSSTAHYRSINDRVVKQRSHFNNSDSSMSMESFPDTENYKFGETSVCFFKNSVNFNELDHSYCSNNLPSVSEIPNSECAQEFIGNVLQQKKGLVLQAKELYQSITDDLCDHSNPKNADKFVLDEREIIIDSDGNELYLHDASQPSDNVRYDQIHEAIVETEKKESRKRLHSSLHHTKYNTSSNSEYGSVFFDKIPSYYTALSIPSKPVTTTVFASATKAIGTTDHLDLFDTSGPFEGHYDKVPAHRRCFTNTTKEVEIKFDSTEIQNSVDNCVPMQAFQKCSHDVENLTLPFQSVQACVGNLPASDTKHLSRSHSPYSKTQGRHSRSITRCCGSASRFSRRSASSLSDCSTCSSCSTSSDCSTCSVLSRSPSSSSSEGGSSRSSSSDSSQSNKYSAKRASHHLTPSKVRQSRSRTVSPEELGWRSKKHTYRNRHSVSVEVKMSEKRKRKEEEQVKAMEERRIVYVGKIPDGYTKKQLYQRFQNFGEIRDVKVNFREHGDNYGFVTYAYACDAIAAKEKGNSVPGEVRFDLCFGGRRHFCSDQYSDLDGNREIEEEYAPMPKSLPHELDYAALLKMHSTHQKK